ncbi:polysaccharide pyruvyl transferase family protein [Methylomonas methanica]|uniref:Exopolysaccharide biosynthesis protein-like protein n=1 Tax=Methylomonas methanica (strain DSM 25384 / MC09) TaxID=857087 RepID=G0A1G8_METMM|nr:polysaccharide pyruvyl transferase family protein [Methylomonas methanica]AEF98861.1 exopolysaccharide biosynthesis protein-like protein [Methylomonas methanica MC09]
MKFIDFLIKNSEKKIYVDPCSGNNGDRLIWLGMQEVLSKSRANVVENVADADLIIINGGGMFIDAYKQGINKVLEFTNSYPDKPLCIAPNSFHFTAIDFGKVLDHRCSPMYIFSREKYSKSYIDSLVANRPLISSYMDHDLAFNLEGSSFIDSILNQYSGPHKGNVLVVDRMDVEHSKAAGKVGFLKKIYVAVTPDCLKDVVRVIRIKMRNKTGSSFTVSAKNTLFALVPGYKIETIVTKDISRPDICNFDEFIWHIAEADYVFTNRLHVGVLAHLLNRRVFMAEGSYHKMRGIYEYSMTSNPNTKIMN